MIASFSAKLYAIISHNVKFVELVRTCLSEKKNVDGHMPPSPPPPAQFKPSTVETNYVVNSHAYPLRSSSKKILDSMLLFSFARPSLK